MLRVDERNRAVHRRVPERLRACVPAEVPPVDRDSESPTQVVVPVAVPESDTVAGGDGAHCCRLENPDCWLREQALQNPCHRGRRPDSYDPWQVEVVVRWL